MTLTLSLTLTVTLTLTATVAARELLEVGRQVVCVLHVFIFAKNRCEHLQSVGVVLVGGHARDIISPFAKLFAHCPLFLTFDDFGEGLVLHLVITFGWRRG